MMKGIEMIISSYATISQTLTRASCYLRTFCAKCTSRLALSFLIQDVSDTQQVLGRPEMDVDSFGRPGIGVAETSADELDRNTFFIKGRAEIMADCMWSEPRYPGVPGKFFTEAVQTIS